MEKRTFFCSAALILGLALPVTRLSADDQKQQAPIAQPQPQTSTHKLHIKKGGRDDINAIGKRKIVNMDWYSLAKEKALGDEQARRFEQNIRFVVDPAVTEYVDRLGQKLAQNSDVQVPVSIKVIDSADTNETDAFSVTGGHVYVTSGLILDCENEAELAGTIAHAIAHVAARHAMRLLINLELANLLSSPLTTVSDPQGKAGIALPITFLKFRRDYEMEADYFGIQYLYKSGYDPMVFLARLQKEDKQNTLKPNTLGAHFAVMPLPSERIGAAEKEISRILPQNDHLIVDTPEFDSIKARLAERKTPK